MTVGDMTSSPPLVIFTDLDGTLLDHVTYDWGPARPALDRLAANGVPVVLSSSKTAAEVAFLQSRIGLSGQPAIVENGAGLIGLKKGMAQMEDYTALRHALDSLPQPLRKRFRGFGDMSLAEVIAATGLPEDDAARARSRAFSEPGLWSGDTELLHDFLNGLTSLGITAKQGGRFLTLSFGATKADRMAEVIAHFQPKHTIALGDAPNDVEMLRTADVGVIVANPHHPPLPSLDGEDTGRISRTELPGPAGWNASVLALLDKLGFDGKGTEGPDHREGTQAHG